MSSIVNQKLTPKKICQPVTTNLVQEQNIKNQCNICKKAFNTRQAKSKHLKKCKITDEIKLKNENELLKKQLEEQTTIFQNQYEELKTKVETINKIPSAITDNSHSYNNTTNNTTNNTNSNNVYNVYAFGEEKLDNLFNDEQTLKILGKGFNSLQYLISLLLKLNKYKNIQITNLRSNIAHVLDKTMQKYIVTNQEDAVRSVTNDRINDIMEMQERLADQIPQKTENRLNELYYDYDKNPNRHYNDTKQTIYNNSQNFNDIKNQEIKVV